MKVYSEAQVTQVFIIGILYGLIMGSLLLSKLKSKYVKDSKVLSCKRVIPTAANSEYQRIA